jgi:hypothetical protein
MPMTPNEQAWIVKEYLAGRMQTEIARELGTSSMTVCAAIKSFCDDWSGADVARLRAYNDERKKYAFEALQNYFLNTGGNPWKPHEQHKPVQTQQFRARSEHAWLLRAEIVFAFGRRVTKSAKRVRIRFEEIGRPPQ